jgi:hypothetical protein
VSFTIIAQMICDSCGATCSSEQADKLSKKQLTEARREAWAQGWRWDKAREGSPNWHRCPRCATKGGRS